MLKNGDLLTERELNPHELTFSGDPLVVGDILTITLGDRTFPAKVVWGNWPGRAHPPSTIVPLRVQEL